MRSSGGIPFTSGFQEGLGQMGLSCIQSPEKTGNNLTVQTRQYLCNVWFRQPCLPLALHAGPPGAVETRATQVLLGLNCTGGVCVCVCALNSHLTVHTKQPRL